MLGLLGLGLNTTSFGFGLATLALAFSCGLTNYHYQLRSVRDSTMLGDDLGLASRGLVNNPEKKTRKRASRQHRRRLKK